MATLEVPGEDAAVPKPEAQVRSREIRRPAAASRHALGIRFVDPNPRPVVEGLGELPGSYNFFLGRDPAGWRSDIRSFERVIYRDVWPGVDVVYRHRDGRLTYEILAAPGVDPSTVSFDYEGGTVLQEAGGVYRIETPGVTVEDRRPTAANPEGLIEFSSRSAAELAASWASTTQPQTDQASGSNLELYWSTFLGGERDEAVYALVLDDSMRPVVVGATRSADFPTTVGALDTTYAGSFDAFVTKFDVDGSTVLWSTFLGDVADDRAWAVDIDGSNRPVVVGITFSAAFPVTGGAYDTSHNGDFDAFVAKLAADGSSLVWSTFYGGDDTEWDVSGVRLDDSERAVFSGNTRSTDLPTSSGAYDDSLGGVQDAFVASISADGSSLVYGTYLGGSGFDTAGDVAVDSTGRPVVVGTTDSTDFPTSPGAFQSSLGGSAGLGDCFVAKLSSTAGSLVFGTYLGGDAVDEGFAVDVDDADGALVTGIARSSNFPTTPGAFDQTYGGSEDAFVARISSDGTTLQFGTYYGGGAGDRGLDLVRDPSGRPVFVGWTCTFEPDFPTTGNAYDDTFNGPCDTFLAKLEYDLSRPLYSTYVGGWRDEIAYGLALDEFNRPVVGGETLSTNFPVTPGAYQTTSASPNEWVDGFVYSMDLPAVWCTDVTGTSTPWLTLGESINGNCPRKPPEGMLVDLVEGDLANLSPTDIGPVEQIACASAEVTFESASTPTTGQAFFQLARFAPGGSYTDGGGSTLASTRTPTSGDCP